MPFSRPTPEELREQLYAALESNLPDTDPRLPDSFLNAIALMTAGGLDGEYGALLYILNQIWATTASAEWLDRHGSPIAVYRKAATSATGNVTFTGSDGITIPIGTRLSRSDGVTYDTTQAVVISGGTSEISVESVDFNANTDAVAGVTLTLQSPIIGVNSTATVASGGLTGGTDQETDEAYRARILQRKRETPQSGAERDYIRWALEVSGVSEAWVVPGAFGTGALTVYILEDGDAPSAGLVNEVDNYLGNTDTTRRPVTANVTVLAPTKVTQNITVTITPDNASTQAAVEDQLSDYFNRLEPASTIYLSKLREAVSRAAGVTDSNVTFPAADVSLNDNEFAVLGTVSFV